MPSPRPGFVKVATRNELPPGSGKLVIAHDKPIALFNVNGEFYAVNYICPHMGGPIGEGSLNGYVVACPWHGWTFDVRSGLPDHPGGHAIAAYEVKLEGDAVLVGWLKRS
ncbi:MAG: Rieske (2Fe-2S) protein [Terriglobia bacterium]